MVNLLVAYVRGNYALSTLVAEISAKWGRPERPYEFVTGWKSATNFSGHCPDNNGVVHGVDIFVGPGNLSAPNADVLTAFLRREGLKGTIPGHPDRLYYIIYRDQIAGDFSNWEWVGAGYGHWDHIHVSTCDLFWGDPAPISRLDYDSTAPWGLASTTLSKPQSGNITPIKEAALSAAEVNQIKAAIAAEGLKNRNYVAALLVTKWSDGKNVHPGIGLVVEQNQRDIRGVGAKVDKLAAPSIDYDKLASLVADKLAGGIEISGSLEARK